MFDIGFSELVLVFIVGLVVLGPQRMPIAIRTVVGWMRTLRGLAANVQNELTQELKLQELQETINKAEQLNLNTLSPELSKTVEELKASAQKMQSDITKNATDIEADIAEAKAKVQNAIDTDLANTQHTEQLADNAIQQEQMVEHHEKIDTDPTALASQELSPDEQAELTEQDDIMAHMQKYQTEDEPETVSSQPLKS